jgi:hypothetical protein
MFCDYLLGFSEAEYILLSFVAKSSGALVVLCWALVHPNFVLDESPALY